jgi:hypothetical protein
VDRAYYEDIAGHLRGLLIRLNDRLPGKYVTLIAEFIDANELGLALEQIADVLSEDEQPRVVISSNSVLMATAGSSARRRLRCSR